MDYVNYTRVIDKPVLIINSNREPLKRIISAFFQNINVYLNESPENILKMNVDDLIEKFKKNYYSTMVNNSTYSGVCEWLDDGLNVYQTPFDKEKGYQIFNHKDKIFLNLSFDKIDQWENIIRSETPYKKFELLKSNISDQKWYGKLYREFNLTIQFDSDELKRIYQNPFWKKEIEYYGFDKYDNKGDRTNDPL